MNNTDNVECELLNAIRMIGGKIRGHSNKCNVSAIQLNDTCHTKAEYILIRHCYIVFHLFYKEFFDLSLEASISVRGL